MLDEERVERVPVLQVLKRQPKEVVLTALLRLPEQAPGYIFGAFVFTYGTTVLSQSRNFLLIGVLVQAVLGFLWVTVAGHLSDRIGRKNMYIIGCLLVAVFGFVYFAMLDSQVTALIFVAIALSGLPIMTMYGPEAALIAESFSPRSSPVGRRRLSRPRYSPPIIRACRSPCTSSVVPSSALSRLRC